MWSSRLFWKLFFVYAGLNLTLAVGFVLTVTSWQRNEINEQVEQRLHDTAAVLRSHARPFLSVVLDEGVEPTRKVQTEDELQAIVKRLAGETRTRLTIVDANGMVLADSERDPKTMMNHANRPELIAARKAGRGTVTRRSPTLGIDMFYFALPVEIENGNRAFVRVAVRLDTINQRLASVRRLLWLCALVMSVVAAGLTYAMVGRMIRPLSQLTQKAKTIARGEDEDPVPVKSQDEIGLLAEAFNQMQVQLASRVRELREGNAQMATVLRSMDEGIIAVDADENILLANDTSMPLAMNVRRNPGR